SAPSIHLNPSTTTQTYTLSLHDALPISGAGRAGYRTPGGTLPGRGAVHPAARAPAGRGVPPDLRVRPVRGHRPAGTGSRGGTERSEEHTSELQSRFDLVCRLLLEKRKKK